MAKPIHQPCLNTGLIACEERAASGWSILQQRREARIGAGTVGEPEAVSSGVSFRIGIRWAIYGALAGGLVILVTLLQQG